MWSVFLSSNVELSCNTGYPSIVSSSLVAIQNSEGACLLLLGKIYLIGQSPEDFLSHVKFSFFLDVASFSGFQIRIALSFFSLADAQLISCWIVYSSGCNCHPLNWKFHPHAMVLSSSFFCFAELLESLYITNLLWWCFTFSINIPLTIT